jgi:hypothetical protein
MMRRAPLERRSKGFSRPMELWRESRGGRGEERSLKCDWTL